jgi:glycosyltransferase involved in cell wall biosynthesis
VRICSPHCGIDPETTSGGETYERELLRHLAASGVMVDLLLARHKRYPDGVANWTIHRLPIGRGLRWPVAALLLPPVIKRLHDRTPFDVLRVHSLRYIGPAALLARRWYRLDVPIVAHHHHLDPSVLNSVIERRVILGSERVVTVSEFSRRQLASELGVPVDRVVVVPNGVDVRFAPSPGHGELRQRLGLGERPAALFLGGLKKRKNLEFLLGVWREVSRRRPDALLLVAGAGPLRSRLDRLASALGVDAHVRFVGRVPEAEKVAYYNLADLFVFPSALEGFGFAVGEAMSCGLPVVVAGAGALPELVADGAGGLVCPPGDAPAFVRAVLRLLEDAELRRRFGALNVQRVDAHFRWPKAAARVQAIYEDVLADWKRGIRA